MICRVAEPSSLPGLGRCHLFPLIPQANGVLENLGQGKHRLTVLSGKLQLKELWVAGSAPCKDVEMVPGKTLDITAK